MSPRPRARRLLLSLLLAPLLMVALLAGTANASPVPWTWPAWIGSTYHQGYVYFASGRDQFYCTGKTTPGSTRYAEYLACVVFNRPDHLVQSVLFASAINGSDFSTGSTGLSTQFGVNTCQGWLPAGSWSSCWSGSVASVAGGSYFSSGGVVDAYWPNPGVAWNSPTEVF